MTQGQYQSLLIDLDNRMASLAICPAEVPETVLKALVHGRVMLVVVDGPFRQLVFVQASKTALDELFPTN